MSEKLNIMIFDESNKIIEDVIIPRPKSYEDLIKSINETIKKPYQNFIIFYKTKNDKEIIIDSNEVYNKTSDLIFIKENKNPPNCRNVLKFKDSKQKLDYKGNIKIEVETIDKKNILEEKEKNNNNLNLMGANEIKKLENENENITNEHEKFFGKTAQLLKNVLNKLNEINSMLNKNKNIKNKNSLLINLIEEISKNNIKSNIDIISKTILKEFESIIPLIKGGETKNNNYLRKSTKDIRPLFPAFKDNLNCDKKKNKNNEKQNKKKRY